MKLDKAIELGKEAVQSLKQGKFHDHADAVQLGISAIHEIQRLRQSRRNQVRLSLLGETEGD